SCHTSCHFKLDLTGVFDPQSYNSYTLYCGSNRSDFNTLLSKNRTVVVTMPSGMQSRWNSTFSSSSDNKRVTIR
ncbi:MAG: hypothetical protein ACRCSB_02645, partial [Bacteroidales bacterium]